ncbi:MAG: hypothetical protein ACXVCP_16890 [Bdellovibrio sp.]
MKTFLILASALLFFQLSLAAEKTVKAETNQKKKSQLGTSFRFDGSKLRGKYQGALNTAATVENDKLLEDLLKGRTQFNDRVQEETERN